MREIKFRAWDEKRKEITIDFNISSNGMIFDCAGAMHECDSIPRSEFLLMQYTGLKDKNGKEIYEGDIVKTTADEILIQEVFYRQEVCAFEMRKSDKSNTYELATPEHYLEVIGNIYENKEVLNDN